MNILTLNLNENFLKEFNILCEKENWNIFNNTSNNYIIKADYILIDTKDSRYINNLREITNRPIILINDNLSQYDKLLLFENGIDFYFNYPEPLEFIWQLRAFNTMETRLNKKINRIINIGDFKIDLLTKDIKLFDRTINFTETERDIFINLLNNKGSVISREKLANGSRSVDVHIRRIREKLKKITDRDYILTARNRGYYFNSGEL